LALHRNVGDGLLSAQAKAAAEEMPIPRLEAFGPDREREVGDHTGVKLKRW